MKTQTEIAEQIAREVHQFQFRRDGVTPYIKHPENVAARLTGRSDDITATAWLHDVIEDCGLSEPDLINRGVSKLVARAVLDMSKHES